LSLIGIANGSQIVVWRPCYLEASTTLYSQNQSTLSSEAFLTKFLISVLLSKRNFEGGQQSVGTKVLGLYGPEELMQW